MSKSENSDSEEKSSNSQDSFEEKSSEEEWIEKEDTVQLYTVFCDKYSVSELKKCLRGFGNEDSVVGPVKIQRYGKKSRKTNRNLCIMSKDIFRAMVDAGHTFNDRKDDMSIVKYKLRAVDFPKKNQEFGFHVRLPTDNSVKFYRKKLESKLGELMGLKFLNCKYKVIIPSKKGNKTQHCGRAFVHFFDNDVDEGMAKKTRIEVVLTKLILSESRWDDKISLLMFISWYRDPDTEEKMFSKVSRRTRKSRSDQNNSKDDYDSKNRDHFVSKRGGDDVLSKLEKHYD